MFRHVQFFIRDHRGLVEKLGSDGVMPLDGRWSLATCIAVAATQGNKRKYAGFEIRQGSYSKYRVISPFIGLVQPKEIKVTPIISADGKRQLVHKTTHAPAYVGEIVKCFRGEPARICSASPPPEGSGKSGYVYVNEQLPDGSFTNREDHFYVGVYGLQWVERTAETSGANEA